MQKTRVAIILILTGFSGLVMSTCGVFFTGFLLWLGIDNIRGTLATILSFPVLMGILPGIALLWLTWYLWKKYH